MRTSATFLAKIRLMIDEELRNRIAICRPACLTPHRIDEQRKLARIEPDRLIKAHEHDDRFGIDRRIF